MKPSDIKHVLDLSLKLRRKGKNYIPLFAGDAGIGKSEINQQWVEDKRKENPNFWFYDLRLAYLEAPDLIGLNKIVSVDGKDRSSNVLPDFWPDSNDHTIEGLLLIEEPNRAQSDILNALMQLLTDRKVHGYTLPPGVVIAGCINPDNGNYDVTNMDAALKNRFEIFDVRYNRDDHINFMKDQSYDTRIVNFVESGGWVFKPIEELGTEGVYISPRTWSKVDSVLRHGDVDDTSNLTYDVLSASLGKHVATAFFKFCNEQRPLEAKDFKGKKRKAAFARLKDMVNPDTYRGDLLEITANSIIEAYPKNFSDKDLFEVVGIMPADKAVNMVRKCWANILSLRESGALPNHTMTVEEWSGQFPEIFMELKQRVKGTIKSDKVSKPDAGDFKDESKETKTEE